MTHQRPIFRELDQTKRQRIENPLLASESRFLKHSQNIPFLANAPNHFGPHLNSARFESGPDRTVHMNGSVLANPPPQFEELSSGHALPCQRGCDLSKKQSIAQTRYMDKQKVAPIGEAVGGTPAVPLRQAAITGHNTNNSFKQSSARAEIFGILPELLKHQSKCACFEFGCQINAKLLRYFLETEKELALKADLEQGVNTPKSDACC